MSRARRSGAHWSACLLAAAVAVAGVGVAGPRPGAAASRSATTVRVTDRPTPSATPSREPVGFGWPTVRCATGTMTGHVAVPNLVWVSGSVQPCPGVADATYAQFSVVYYLSARAVRGRAFTYESATGPTPFGGRLRPHGTDLVAVCLAAGPDYRLACLALERSTDGVTLVSIAPDDPRVVHVPPPEGGPSGGEDTGMTCGNCV